MHYHTVSPAIAKTPLERTQPVAEFLGDIITEITKYFSTSVFAR